MININGYLNIALVLLNDFSTWNECFHCAQLGHRVPLVDVFTHALFRAYNNFANIGWKNSSVYIDIARKRKSEHSHEGETQIEKRTTRKIQNGTTVAPEADAPNLIFNPILGARKSDENCRSAAAGSSSIIAHWRRPSGADFQAHHKVKHFLYLEIGSNSYSFASTRSIATFEVFSKIFSAGVKPL